MTQAVSKRDSIYVQLLKLLIGAAAVALLVFLGLDHGGEKLIDCYYYTEDYEDRQDQRYVDSLQSYIEKNQIGSRDTDALYSWIKKQKIVSIRIYKDGIRVFDTEYPNQELWDEEIAMDAYGWERYYTVTFADGEAQVSIMGMYAYQFYNYALVAELVFSFLLFLLLVLLGIRRKMNYIRKLSSEIEILEGGSLDYEVTVKGRDELAALAEGLNSMRLSFREMMEREAKIMRENQKAVTEMSHDLRTPVTAILLYTEILKKGTYKSEEQRREYVEKIDRKACRMKQLTDHLFEYTLVTGETQASLEEPESLETLFYDLLSETSSYLEQKGFRLQCQVEWRECDLRVSTDYVTRIMDNVTSNIVKYARREEPVLIRSVYKEKAAGFSFANGIDETKGKKVESTSVGIQSVRSMMEKMGGSCAVKQAEGRFELEILFPVHKGLEERMWN